MHAKTLLIYMWWWLIPQCTVVVDTVTFILIAYSGLHSVSGVTNIIIWIVFVVAINKAHSDWLTLGHYYL